VVKLGATFVFATLREGPAPEDIVEEFDISLPPPEMQDGPNASGRRPR
jgi:hypothetical protein